MSVIPYSWDLYLAPVVLTSANNTVVVGGVARSISPGTYWPYLTSGPAGYPALYDALIAAMVSAGASGMAMRAATPTESTGSPLAGLLLEAGDVFTLDFSSPNFTLDPRIFGFPEGWATDAVGAGAELASPRCRWPIWAPTKLASYKPADTTHEQYGARYPKRWATTTTRVLEYRNLPAANVRRTRAAEEALWAASAGLALGDTNNNLQTAWEEGWSKGLDVLAVHGEARVDLAVSTHPYEVLRMIDREARDRFLELQLGEVDRGGERYDVAVPVEVVSGTYRHS